MHTRTIPHHHTHCSEGYQLWQISERVNHLYKLLRKSVQIESGKGLSTNDFTDYYKRKIDNLPSHPEIKLSDDLGNNLELRASGYYAKPMKWENKEW